ncbi:MAG: 2-amino-4-hydroxy-6-hydroxymethyldihydropteridine diphosphokinase [Chloroflexi bacterium]|nr:2-amino-4-hydroxy-6-hydroxymethyldihydropteridine diphosphokinase [Chloroflexota bacterium]MCH8115296.1 2-amino-4-hydroxy-6-hydroxymethyldihydropteridine diphosphokinase [Chloroflexota bacterium]MCI0774582.1 2-amino-4-hydroxy-6-hydroxymethyldihydropteridine diphosphokinase [Chloroflexota bacterium]MCI0803888.1 2-amino-4-hydroxy-6-hydroxymethyldihydropteridine diphosphokinase [Chloroflexota bacterium]MCI0808624.1 2-amino-4-hydroxy-6-hydroxymethyldihydropteridine diphosphokinase [Chloroflexota
MTAYIGLGSNLGDRSKNLSGAVERLSRIGTIAAVSAIYETKPWGVDGYQPRYLNQVAAVNTALDPLEVVAELLGIEHSLGRTRQEKNASRTLDLDLLLHGESVVDASGVSVPHPRLHERAFVLVPLAEIAPDIIHPVLNRTVFELAEGADRSGVSLMR